jgi:hypothetical protein
MTSDLSDELLKFLPKAIAWANAEHSSIVENGKPLSEDLLAVAKRVGVSYPERIRIVEVPCIPQPQDPGLKQFVLARGFLGPDTHGITFSYGIYIRHGYHNVRLLSHEFRHVYQYEQAGSIAAFIPYYLGQIAARGYVDSPLEIDARNCEQCFQ